MCRSDSNFKFIGPAPGNPPLWRESLHLGALDLATKAVEHLCQISQSAAVFSRATQASLEPRSGNGCELSGLMSVLEPTGKYIPKKE